MENKKKNGSVLCSRMLSFFQKDVYKRQEQELAPWPFLEKEAEDAQPEAPAKKPEEKSAPQTAEPPAARPAEPVSYTHLMLGRGALYTR